MNMTSYKSIQSKLRLEKSKLIEQLSYQLVNFTIQNQPALKMKRADYLGRVIVEQNRAVKVDSYW
jgi:hypothetical protein